VVYLIGYPRSGTTVLGNALNEIDGFFHAGELRDLWSSGLPRPRQLCGCRQHVCECALWRRIFAEAYGDVASVNRCAYERNAPLPLAHCLPGPVQLQSKRQALVASWRVLLSSLIRPPSRPMEVADYADDMAKLYRAIASVTGQAAIVDSSKSPHDANAIATSDELDVRFVHVIRDPRGVAVSRTASSRPEGADRPSRNHTSRLVLEALRWSRDNLVSEVVALRSRRPYLRMRYEDFVRDPARVLEQVTRFSAGEAPDIPPIEQQIVLGTNHTVSGNRNRWRTGVVEISEDMRWKRVLSNPQRRLLDTLTVALRVRYGFR
jgi:hypothetical protein